MDNTTVLVLANAADPLLKKLAALPEETSIAVGDTAEAFARSAAGAGVLFNWSESGPLFREVFTLCPPLRWVHSRAAGLECTQRSWVHSRAAGLDNLLFPELVESPVP